MQIKNKINSGTLIKIALVALSLAGTALLLSGCNLGKLGGQDSEAGVLEKSGGAKKHLSLKECLEMCKTAGEKGFFDNEDFNKLINKDNCDDACRAQDVLDRKDYEACGTAVKIDVVKDVCWGQAIEATGNIEYCDRYSPGGQIARMACISKLAIEKKDPALCDRMKGIKDNDFFYYSCLNEAGGKQPENRTDSAACALSDEPAFMPGEYQSFQKKCFESYQDIEMTDKLYKFVNDSCQIAYVVSNKDTVGKDTSVCLSRKIFSDDQRDGCFYQVSLAASKYQYCDCISDDLMRDNCYAGVASKTKDASVCEHKLRHDTGSYTLCMSLVNAK